MGLFRIIFILILVWYVIKLIIRYVLPKALFHFINKQQGFDNETSGTSHTKKGKVNIKMEHPPKRKKEQDDFGEYVDFEEVKPEQKAKNED